MNAIRTLAVVVATGLSLTACATGGAPAAGKRSLAPERATATVAVENRNWQDVRVFALVGGVRHRLGTVNTMQTQRFPIPRHLTAQGRDVQVLVDPVGGGGSFLSPRVQVYAGQEVNLSVQNHLPISSIAVFDRR